MVLRERQARDIARLMVFGAAYLLGLIPTFVSNAVNTGNPFKSAYSSLNLPSLDFSFSVVPEYMADLQGPVILFTIAWTIWAVLNGNRTAIIVAVNLVVNLLFFLTYAIFTTYYLMPLASLACWTLLFSGIRSAETDFHHRRIPYQSAGLCLIQSGTGLCVIPPQNTVTWNMMDAPAGHDQNADQIAYWNGPAGQRWADRQAAQDVLLGPVADLAVDRARLQAGRARDRCRLRQRRHHDRVRAQGGAVGPRARRRRFGADAGAGAAGARRRTCRSISCWRTPRSIRSSRRASICWPRGSA